MTPSEFVCLGIGFIIGCFMSAWFGYYLDELKRDKNDKNPPIYIGGLSNGGNE